jgi:dihydrofolate synthase / folylpolyglutamate synthase
LTGLQRTLPEWLDYQQRQHPKTIALELERVQRVAARLGLLPARCPAVIVAGTNGKGSTATFLASLLSAHGARTGLFTSPHLVRYSERICIDGRECNEAALLGAFERIEAARGSEPLTFFEYNTLAALELFRTAAVNAMVLEVGLGGRLDATNIIDADVAVLCSVGLDHQDWLGATLEDIGGEKAGIFRRGQPVVLGNAEMPASVWQRAEQLGCSVRTAGEQFQWLIHGDGAWDYREPGSGYELLALPAPGLSGQIQYRNAATALAALRALFAGRQLQPAAIVHGLTQARLAGRLQVIAGAPEWIFDVAHNVPAAKVLAGELAAREARARTLAVVGMLADKDAGGVARQLDAHIDHWILCDIHEPRGLSAAQLRERFGSLRGTIEEAASIAAGCARAKALAHAGERIVVFGSFHAVGPALEALALY